MIGLCTQCPNVSLDKMFSSVKLKWGWTVSDKPLHVLPWELLAGTCLSHANGYQDDKWSTWRLQEYILHKITYHMSAPSNLQPRSGHKPSIFFSLTWDNWLPTSLFGENRSTKIVRRTLLWWQKTCHFVKRKLHFHIHYVQGLSDTDNPIRQMWIGRGR